MPWKIPSTFQLLLGWLMCGLEWHRGELFHWQINPQSEEQVLVLQHRAWLWIWRNRLTIIRGMWRSSHLLISPPVALSRIKTLSPFLHPSLQLFHGTLFFRCTEIGGQLNIMNAFEERKMVLRGCKQNLVSWIGFNDLRARQECLR